MTIAMDSVLGDFGSWVQEVEDIPPLSCPKVQLKIMTWMIVFLINFSTGCRPGSGRGEGLTQDHLQGTADNCA